MSFERPLQSDPLREPIPITLFSQMYFKGSIDPLLHREFQARFFALS
jgi:hypothetical protein